MVQDSVMGVLEIVGLSVRPLRGNEHLGYVDGGQSNSLGKSSYTQE